MCGIAGWFGPLDPVHDTGDVLRRMSESIAHRGPDGHGSWFESGVGLSHRRLAIIDLEAGSQPMTSECGNCVISYNGEIYNYKALRWHLADYPFRTGSDTEVILALYLREGIDGFNRLRGMFAFALWDKRSRTGFLARDPFGIKPLFFHENPDKLVFGSEVKAIFEFPGITKRLDPGALNNCLNFRYLPGNSSLFKDIRQVQPGTVEIFSTSRTRRKISFPNIRADDIGDAIDSSVAAHLVADVPVALYLSGGLDSGLVAESARRVNPGITSFTLDAGDDPMEAENAAETASILGISNTRLPLAGFDADTLKTLVRHLEVPKINALQSFLLSRATSRHCKVTLSGLGGDEHFYGYNAHRIFFQAHRARALRYTGITSLARLTGKAFGPRKRWTEKQRAVMMLGELGNWPRVYGLLRNLWDEPAMRRQLYGERMLDHAPQSAFDTLESLWPDHRDPVTAMHDFELEQKMTHDLLWNEDRTSMANSLEVRTPFVDAAFYSLLQDQPRETLFPEGKRKAVLREVAHSRLPAKILQRPKSGFQVDAGTFYHHQLKQTREIFLSRETILRHGIFNYQSIERYASLPPTRKYRWHYLFLYMALMTHIWMEEFMPSE